MKNNNFIFAIICFFVCVFFAALFYVLRLTSGSLNELVEIKIGESVFFAEIADTDNERTQGLSGRESLPENTGMLFVFEEPSKTGFWMKNMNFPIDMIWIQESKVIGFVENMKPEQGIPDEYFTIYSPPLPIDMAFEVSAGTVEEKNIRAGDDVSLLNTVKPRQ